ncbi:MAG: transposase [Ostreibacterium sp.]
MNNASFHKRSDILDIIKDSQYFVAFLRPYRPDLNPIEHKWAQAKAMRRKYRCTLVENWLQQSQFLKSLILQRKKQWGNRKS